MCASASCAATAAPCWPRSPCTRCMTPWACRCTWCIWSARWTVRIGAATGRTSRPGAASTMCLSPWAGPPPTAPTPLARRGPTATAPRCTSSPTPPCTSPSPTDWPWPSRASSVRCCRASRRNWWSIPATAAAPCMLPPTRPGAGTPRPRATLRRGCTCAARPCAWTPTNCANWPNWANACCPTPCPPTGWACRCAPAPARCWGPSCAGWKAKGMPTVLTGPRRRPCRAPRPRGPGLIFRQRTAACWNWCPATWPTPWPPDATWAAGPWTRCAFGPRSWMRWRAWPCWTPGAGCWR